MNVYVCFELMKKRKHWWDWFTNDFSHCFVVQDGYKLDDRFNGTRLTKLDVNNGKDIVAVSVALDEERVTNYWLPTFTCAGFCAKFIGQSGLFITPKQLYRRLLNG